MLGVWWPFGALSDAVRQPLDIFGADKASIGRRSYQCPKQDSTCRLWYVGGTVSTLVCRAHNLPADKD